MIQANLSGGVGLTRRRFGSFLPVILSMLVSAQLLADEVARPEIPLPTKRWDALPGEVKDVHVGPDGRHWYEVARADHRRSLEAIKEDLQREFNRPNPRISEAALALLEPSGAAWFYLDARHILARFDGKRWIERNAGPECRFVGHCATLGQVCEESTNWFADGICWFRDSAGIHRFDGNGWTYQAIPAKPGFNGAPRLAVSPNGKLAAAHVVDTLDFWIFENGKWSVRHPFAGRRKQVQQFVITDEGVIWLTELYGLDSFTKEPGSELETNPFPAIVRDLGSPQFQKREAATRRLKMLGQGVLPKIEDELKKTDDPEVRRRLNDAAHNLAKAPKKRAVEFGNCMISGNFVGLYRDQRGRVFVAAAEVKAADHPVGPGLVILDPDGSSHHFLGPVEIQGWSRSYSGQPPPLLTSDGKGVWLSLIKADRASGLFDLQSGRVLADVPHAAYDHLLAIDQDGRVFTARSSSLSAHKNQGIMVFSPGMPDRRPPLEVQALPGEPVSALMAGAGSIWALQNNVGFKHFDGTSWKALAENKAQGQLLAAGTGGIMLARGDQGYLLFRNDDLIDTAQILKTLIEDHREIIAQAFRFGAPGCLKLQTNWMNETQRFNFRAMLPDGIGLVADAKKNIWLRLQSELHVLHDNGWLRTRELLEEAGRRHPTIEYLSPIGESKVFASELRHRGKAFIGEIANGGIKFSPVACCPTRPFAAKCMLDRDGDLWITGDSVRSPDAVGYLHGQIVVRLGDDGSKQELQDAGEPILADESGNMWLAGAQGEPGNRVNLWRNGRKVQSIDLPATFEVFAACCNGPGSVFLWTAAGLQHLLADTPAQDHYRIDKTYAVTGLPSHTLFTAYSNEGYLLVQSQANKAREQTFPIQLIKLPSNR